MLDILTGTLDLSILDLRPTTTNKIKFTGKMTWMQLNLKSNLFSSTAKLIVLTEYSLQNRSTHIKIRSSNRFLLYWRIPHLRRCIQFSYDWRASNAVQVLCVIHWMLWIIKKRRCMDRITSLTCNMFHKVSSSLMCPFIRAEIKLSSAWRIKSILDRGREKKKRKRKSKLKCQDGAQGTS